MKTIAELLKVPGNVVALNGDWGSGKTYSWDNADKPEKTIRGQLEKCGKKTIYVSLFGKQSVSELKEEILNKSINIKSVLFEFCMKMLLLFFTTAIIATFMLQIIDHPSAKRWVLAISVLVAGGIIEAFYYHILRFFCAKNTWF